MQETLSLIYLWLKAGHVIFVVFWMAGMFILPRQMVYMHAAAAGSEEETLWAERIGLLRRIILTPSLILTWVLGLLTAQALGAWDQGWLHAKLLFVVLMTALHGFYVARAKAMIRGERPISVRQLKLWGEAPAVLLVLIVILVVVKPF